MVRHVLVTYLCASVDRYRELWEEGESVGKRKRRGGDRQGRELAVAVFLEEEEQEDGFQDLEE